MPVTKIIRYRTKPEAAEENARLVEGVYAELAAMEPDGFHYATLRLDDGVTFVHVATLEGGNPLDTLPAFVRFQAALAARCEEGPVVADADVVGAWGMGGLRP